MHRTVLAVKKPITVMMTKFNQLGDHPAVVADPTSPTGFSIATLENSRGQYVTPGEDWICEGASVDPYPIKDTKKQLTYDELRVVQET